LSVVVSIIFASTILSSLVAESTMDDSLSCSSYTLREFAALIREEFIDVKTLVMANQINSVEASKQALASALVRE